jgi:predicted ATPase
MWLLGYPDQARQLGEDALRLAEQMDHPPSAAMALLVANIIPLLLGREYEPISDLIDAFTEVTAGHGLRLSVGGVRLAHGRILVHRGDVRTGIREMRGGLADWQATGTRVWAPLYLLLLADAHLEADQVERAQGALDDAFVAVQQSGEHMVESELHRLRGEVLLAQADAEKAVVSFQQAIEVAREQKARSWELRATTSLARLWDRQGRQHEAHRVLATVYSRFSEGFDTPDLRDAGALLGSM